MSSASFITSRTARYLKVKDGAHVKKDDTLGLWDLYNIPIFTEKEGKVQFDDILENETMIEQADAATGTLGKFIVESRERRNTRTLTSSTSKGDVLASYSIPVGARLEVEDGQKATAGQILAKFPRELSKTRDITGGLPRVAELFEARRPKNPAIISEIEGKVRFEESSSGVRKIIIRNDSGHREGIPDTARQVRQCARRRRCCRRRTAHRRQHQPARHTCRYRERTPSRNTF